jgi:putative flippase GtrA
MKKILELFKKYREPIMYIIVGGLTTVVSFATQFLAHLIGADTKTIFADGITLASIQALMNEGSTMLATVISWICSVTFAFFANKILVFESKEKGKGFFALLHGNQFSK